MRTTTALLALAIMAGCKDPSGPKPPDLRLADPEILFHFWYHTDSLGVLHDEPYPDTAIMRWYKGTPSHPELAELLAEVEITGTDTTCAFFLVADSTPLYFDVGWKRHGVISMGAATVGPFDPLDPNNYDHYWDVKISEDTIAGARSVDMQSHRTDSFCTANGLNLARDSISAPANR